MGVHLNFRVGDGDGDGDNMCGDGGGDGDREDGDGVGMGTERRGRGTISRGWGGDGEQFIPMSIFNPSYSISADLRIL